MKDKLEESRDQHDIYLLPLTLRDVKYFSEGNLPRLYLHQPTGKVFKALASDKPHFIGKEENKDVADDKVWGVTVDRKIEYGMSINDLRLIVDRSDLCIAAEVEEPIQKNNKPLTQEELINLLNDGKPYLYYHKPTDEILVHISFTESNGSEGWGVSSSGKIVMGLIPEELYLLQEEKIKIPPPQPGK